MTPSKPKPPPVSKSPELKKAGPKDHVALTKDFITPDEEFYRKERERLHDIAMSTPEGRAELRVLFNELDKDGDGNIAYKEWMVTIS